MGESNCAWNRKALLHRDTILAAAAIYKGETADWALGGFTLKFNILHYICFITYLYFLQ